MQLVYFKSGNTTDEGKTVLEVTDNVALLENLDEDTLYTVQVYSVSHGLYSDAVSKTNRTSE